MNANHTPGAWELDLLATDGLDVVGKQWRAVIVRRINGATVEHLLRADGRLATFESHEQALAAIAKATGSDEHEHQCSTHYHARAKCDCAKVNGSEA